MTYEALVLQKTPIVTFGYIMQVILSLLIVVGLIYLTAKYILPKLQVSTQGKTIQILDRTGLEPQVTAYTIKVGSFNYLIVVSSKSATLIDKFREGELG
ncbi:hypothetical protein HZC34_05125 [Candidatus Saganbacteria bacterium]|nr:hypothetical protein [Candidatus Saganbacteria bacterium]